MKLNQKQIEIWKDIKGYEGKYQVSYQGQIRRIYPSGKIRILKPYIKQNARSILVIGLTKDRKKKEIPVHSLVGQAFLREPKKNEVLYHINGLIKDNWASNLEWIDRRKLGQLTGPQSRKKGVVKIDSNGEMIDFYSSARQAAKANFMSYQTIIDRCNNKVKSLFAPDGCAYAWEDSEKDIDTLIRRIEEYKLAV